MFEIIFSASSVIKTHDICWGIQYGAVWNKFIDSYSEGTANKIINFKLRRLLYDEIIQMEKFPSNKSAKILGYCLNVMGLKVVRSGKYYALHKTVINWTSSNYLRLRSIHPEVANSCIMGRISFDEKSNSLVMTYNKGLSLEAPKEYLELKSTENRACT